jgi:hypothetical protein
VTKKNIKNITSARNHSVKTINIMFLSINLLLLGAVLFLSFSNKASYAYLEASKLKITSPSQSSYIEMNASDSSSSVTFYNKKKNKTMVLESGDVSTISMYDGSNKLMMKLEVNDKKDAILCVGDNAGKHSVVKGNTTSPGFYVYDKKDTSAAELVSLGDNGANLILKDENLNPRVHIKGGNVPGVFLKSTTAHTIGSFTTLKDGGGGFGLADVHGAASTIIRGGDTPNIAFFAQGSEPAAALGVMKKIPHLLISGNDSDEGVLIHGGHPSGMMVVDENGQLKVFISKHGIFHGKEEDTTPKEDKKQKYFSLDEDVTHLFPDAIVR